MKKLIAFGLAAVASAITASAAVAHHSFSMFDPGQEIVIEGEVARWNFTNPHTFLLIQDADGQIWAFEGSAPPSIIGKGMVGDTFVPGQSVTVVMCPLRDGRPGGAVGLVITEDGTVYDPSDGGCHAQQRINEWPEWIAAGYKSRAEAEAASQ